MSAELTRGQFMTRGVALAGATATLAAFGPATMKAVAAGGNVDLEVATYALLLERLEAEYYSRALKEVSFTSSSARDMATKFRESETQHVDALEKLVRQLNGKAGNAPKFDFGPALASEENFLLLAQRFEETGVSAYNGAAPLIENDEILATAGQIVQVEARHAARCRIQNGLRPAPLAFDRPLTMDQVMRRVNRFIEGA